jgi:hypothetical protein
MLSFDEMVRGVDRERASALAEQALQTGFVEESRSVGRHYVPNVLASRKIRAPSRSSTTTSRPPAAAATS